MSLLTDALNDSARCREVKSEPECRQIKMKDSIIAAARDALATSDCHDGLRRDGSSCPLGRRGLWYAHKRRSRDRTGAYGARERNSRDATTRIGSRRVKRIVCRPDFGLRRQTGRRRCGLATAELPAGSSSGRLLLRPRIITAGRGPG